MISRLCRLLSIVATASALGAAGAAVAQDAGQPAMQTPEQRDAASLPLRTALHRDPTLAAPLDRLLALYRGAGAADDLLGMYREHVSQYPDNLSGQTVLVRLLIATGSPETLPRAREAVGRFPNDPYLRYLLWEVLQRQHDREALAALDKAIELEKDPARKSTWVDRLLPAAVAEGRVDLIQKHLVALASLASTPETRLEVAQKMLRHRLFAPALKLLEERDDSALRPETMVSLELEAATAEVGLDRMAAAAARLDGLLDRLTADYWRRGEIVARRLALVKTQAEREAMIAAARKRLDNRPRDESAVLDLAEMLSGFQLRRQALDVLQAAARRMPKSAEIEKRTLDLFDRLHDEWGREKFLAERIKGQPDRDDLVLMRIKTLYLLGRTEEAKAGLDRLVEDAAPADRAATRLAVARFLRRCALPTDAVELLRQVVEAEPSRLDVRRELAETYLALGSRQQVRLLFAGKIPADADQDKLLDLVQFMIQQDLLVEAGRALSERVAREKTSLELRMLLLTVHRRLGSRAEGRELIDQSHELADTVARYRLWLESSLAFHEDFETADDFLAAEQTRLEEADTPWTGKPLLRRLILAEVAARSGRRSEMIAMLREGLAADVPAEDRVAIRRRLVELLDSEQVPTSAGLRPNPAVREHLAALAQEAPESADTCNARLALLDLAVGRQDLALARMSKIRVTKIQDAAILARLKTHYMQYGRQSKVLAILQRLTVLNPTDRSAWEEWMSVLARSGNEAELCRVLRRLLAGVDKMPLADETRTLLKQHLADSQWRSIALRLAGGNSASLADALPLVDSVERLANDDQQWLWVAWIRAYLLGRLGRAEARQEAVAELDRMAARLHDPGNAGSPRILFPDGLSVSLEHARRLLGAGEAPAAVDRAPAPRRGPLPPLAVKWTFQANGFAAVTAVRPLESGRVLVFDAAGTAYCLDAAGGRLLWQREAVLPVAGAVSRRYTYPSPSGHNNSQVLRAARPLADGRGQFYVPDIGAVTCYAVEDGRLLWRADVGAVGRRQAIVGTSSNGQLPFGRPFASLFLYRDSVLTYDPLSGTVTRIDPVTGKIVWDRLHDGEEAAPTGVQDGGASLSGDRLLIWGRKTAILQLPEGKVQWSFDPYRVRTLPVRLAEPSDAADTSSGGAVVLPPSSAQGLSAVRPYSSQASYPPRMGYGPRSAPTLYVDYQQPRSMNVGGRGGIRLTSYAVHWAAQRNIGRNAILLDPWLLLFGQHPLATLRIDLPLATRRPSVQGIVVGTAGRVACVFAGTALQFVDLSSGMVRQCSVQELYALSGGAVGDPSRAPPQTAVDGPLLYATGPGGILAVNTATAQRAFLAPWPEEALPPKAKAATGTVTAAPGYVPGPTGYAPGHTGYRPSRPYISHSGGIPLVAPPNVPTHVPPTVGRVHGGVLYTLVSPSRVVALAQQAADE